MIQGFDFSHNNAGKIDFVKAKAAGMSFAIGKVTEGLTFTDPLFKDRIQAARDAGLIVGGYHFFHPKDDAKDQLNYFLSKLASAGGKFLNAGDFEETQLSGGQEEWDLFDAESRGIMVQDFLDNLAVETRAKPFIYCGAPFSDRYLTAVPTGTYNLWLARYAPTLPKGWTNYSLWQYTCKGLVDGIDSPVDISRFEGSVEDLAAMAG